MLVRLKYRLQAGGIIYERGEQEVPDGTLLPSSAVVIEKRSEVVEKPAEPDTLHDMLPKTAMEKKK